jgi:transcriptional regulator with XRE-family HTH domain
MTLTGSETLQQNPVVWIDQTALTNQKQQFSTSIDHETYFSSFLRSIRWFSNSTGDGGVLLNPSTSAFFAWSICIQVDHISRILPRVIISSKVMSDQFIHSSPSGQTSAELPPHLDALRWIEIATNLSQERIGRLVGVTRQTINNWQNGESIKDPNRRRIFAVRDVLERAAHRYQTREQLTAWLDTPRGADGRTPAELLAANEINRARLLAVSSPSQWLKRPPAWANRPVPNAFRTREEHRQETWSPESDIELANLIRNEDEGTDEDGEELPLR